ncbi:MAG: beta-phosphoglucomutase family hydrolase [Bacteroidales bacterium]|nr:beta-phosphoglucomutase family hydrolase [Bacteroidales bacterium]
MITDFDAVIFDLDGVITDTASIHSMAWKQTLDGVIKHYCNLYDKDYVAFDIKGDYLKYVDGKPRYDGVESFLNSRNIILPYGTPDDESGMLTVCGIGNKKNEIFNNILNEKGAFVFESTIKLINDLIENDIRVGVASSSKNCRPILKKAGLEHYFEVFIDGIVSVERNLKGKPEPDIFLTACKDLGVSPDRAVVVEDASSGVAAGKAGNFGLVIGIARNNNHQELKVCGADIVVSDLADINIKDFETWFAAGVIEDSWCLKYADFNPENEKSREALLTVGNGFFASRGCFSEEKASELHYPATYMAGVYNKLKSDIKGKIVENEDLVNCPNWLFTSFKIDDGDWCNQNNCKIIDIERTLDMKRGILSGWAKVEDKAGRQTMIESVRFISMANKNIAAIEYSITPINYSGKISVITGIDGNIINDGVARYRDLNQNHLTKAQTGTEKDIIWLKTSTNESNIEISVAAKIYSNTNSNFDIIESESAINAQFTAELKENQEFIVYKNVAYTNSLDKDKIDAIKLAESLNDFKTILSESVNAWENIWQKADISISGDRLVQKLARLHVYHLFVSFSEHNIGTDTSIGARGLHGEAYRGHIFWDELFIAPFFNIKFPELSKTMLLYRYNRLNEARKYAKENNFEGAMFPWQSGSKGTEETQELHLNPESGKWGPDYSRNQRHVSLAVGYNIIRYYQATDDKNFIKDYGFEMLTEICRFFASAVTHSSPDFRYHTENMMGPDEFHEKSKNSGNKGGLRDNAYTNIMLAWLLRSSMNIFYKQNHLIKDNQNLPSEKELSKWKEISENLAINFNEDGIIEQFDGYFDLKELDWVEYKKKYGNIYRLDRILKAEGKSPDEYKLAKQADTLMIFYNLNDKEINETIAGLGYQLPNDYKTKNFYYYISRTSHGSSLSKIVHAYLAKKWDINELAEKLFCQAIKSDYEDVQGGTTAEGIHTGVMAASVMHILNSFAGIDFRDTVLSIKPGMPEHWQRCAFNFSFRKISYKMIINHDSFNLKTSNDVGLRIFNSPCIIEKDEWWNIDL